MMASGNLPPAIEAVLDECPKLEDQIPEVVDPIPDQRHTKIQSIRRLDPDLERLAIRRAVELFYERERRRGGRSRALVLRNATATAFRISEACLLEPRRCRGITRIRQISMAIMGCLLDVSLPEVGRAFAGRDHTTVLHAQRKMKVLVSEVLTEMYDGQSCQIGGV
jgi:chromosomal replication initiation ATPase DnaA